MNGACLCGSQPCNPQQVCTNGECRCPSGQIACTGYCAAYQTDPQNCGACGTRCHPTETCEATSASARRAARSFSCSAVRATGCVDVLTDARYRGLHACLRVPARSGVQLGALQLIAVGRASPPFPVCFTYEVHLAQTVRADFAESARTRRYTAMYSSTMRLESKRRSTLARTRAGATPRRACTASTAAATESTR